MAISTLERNTVSSSGLEREGDFRIASNAHAFNILSSQIYSNKVRAVLRELSCNAYDAHVYERKQNIPFEIHLPTQYEPWFSVRDFGPGISEEDIFGLYTTYFQSGTYKITSNDYMGFLGIGAKSPFSMVSSFSVTSFQGGIQKNYSMFKSEEGFPKVAKLGESTTTEKDGLLVKFSVKTSDIYNFQSESYNVFKYFKLQPVFTGNRITVPTVKYVIKNTEYGIRKDDGGDIRVVVGNIYYPINQENLPKFKTSKIFSSSVDLFFNIGEVSNLPSREGLHYDKQTIQALTDRINKIVSDIQSDIEVQLQSCTSLHQARKLVYEKIIQGQISQLVDYKILSWNGQKVGDRDVHVTVDKIVVDRYYLESRGYRNIKETVKTRTGISFISLGNEIFENDIPKGGVVRVKNYVKSSKNIVCIVKFEDQKARELFIKEVGCLDSDIRKTSELPKPAKKVNAGNNGFTYALKGKIFKFKPGVYSNSCNYMYWSEITDDTFLQNIKTTKELCIYVPIKSYDIDNKFISHRSYKLDELCRTLKSYSNLRSATTEIKIYGVRADVLKKLGPSWIRLDKYIANNFTQKKLNLMYNKSIVKECIYNDKDFYDLLLKIRSCRNELFSSSKLHSILKLVDFCEKWKFTSYDCSEILSFLNLDKGVSKSSSSIKDKVNKIFTKCKNYYSLLDPLSQLYYNCPEGKQLAAYVTMVDKTTV